MEFHRLSHSHAGWAGQCSLVLCFFVPFSTFFYWVCFNWNVDELVERQLVKTNPNWWHRCKSVNHWKKLIGNNRVCEGHRQGGGWNIFAASTQIHKYRSTQIHKHTNTRGHKYTRTQGNNSTKIHKHMSTRKREVLILTNKVKTNIHKYTICHK